MMVARFILIIAASIHVASASVQENTETYSCEEGTQTLKSEPASRATDCEQSWTAGSTPIGSFISGSVECHHPCINVTAGKLLISGCVNATLTVICYQNHVTEHRIHFQGTPIQPFPRHSFLKQRDRYAIYACLLLLLLILVGFTIQYCKIRNTSENQFLSTI